MTGIIDIAITRRLDGCRICGNRDLVEFVTLKNIPMPEGHVSPDQFGGEFSMNLSLFWCPICSMVQTQHDLGLEDYYRNYHFNVSSSPLVKTYMKTFSQTLWNRFGLKHDHVVLEIGSGDGFQLSCFRDLGAKVMGIEPSNSLAISSRHLGVPVIEELFDPARTDQFPHEFRHAKVIFSQYTLDHLEDPAYFLKGIGSYLDPHEGIVVIEVHDFEKIFDRSEACLFTHEHTIYPSIVSLGKLFEASGFKLLDYNFLPAKKCRGNSLIAVAGTSLNPLPTIDLCLTPALEVLAKSDTYTDFAKTIKRSHQSLYDHVSMMKKNGRTVAGYGAAGRGVNTLVISGISDADIECVYDMNPHLQELLMPVSGVRVARPEQAFEDSPDEIIVFSYGYLKEIEEYFKEYIADGGVVTSLLDYLTPP